MSSKYEKENQHLARSLQREDLSITGRIDIESNFTCQFCRKLAIEPGLSICCDKLICRNPCSLNKNCLTCGTNLIVKDSTFLLKIYASTVIQCPNNCLKYIKLSELKTHNNVCEMKKVECPLCKRLTLTQNIIQHCINEHQESTERMIREMHQKPIANLAKESKVGKSFSSQSYTESNPLKLESNLFIRLSASGRIFCGQQLPINLSHQSSIMGFRESLFGTKKTLPVCSGDQDSCNNCMRMDCDRLALKKNYLLNQSGCVAKYYKDKEVVCCGRKFDPEKGEQEGFTICNLRTQCNDCKKLLDLINKGFYRSQLG